MSERRVILIGGAPTTGKSTLAERVAKHFDLPWISTDQIRTIMRKVARRADHPKLFNPDGYTPERFLLEFSSDEIVRIELQQGEAVWTGASAFIKQEWTWTKGFVVEGVNILPHLVARDFINDPQVEAVFLVDDDVERIRRVIYARGLEAPANSYSDDVKDKEVEWVTLFNRRLRADTTRYGYPLVEVQKSAADLDAVLAVLRR
jgi:2-phosphoglycerate kinase